MHLSHSELTTVVCLTSYVRMVAVSVFRIPSDVNVTLDSEMTLKEIVLVSILNLA